MAGRTGGKLHSEPGPARTPATAGCSGRLRGRLLCLGVCVCLCALPEAIALPESSVAAAAASAAVLATGPEMERSHIGACPPRVQVALLEGPAAELFASGIGSDRLGRCQILFGSLKHAMVQGIGFRA